MIPKKHIPSAAALTEEDGALLGHIFATIARLCNDLGCDGGYRIVSNVGRMQARASSNLHFHVMAKRPWAGLRADGQEKEESPWLKPIPARGGLTRQLTICKVNDHMDIAAFIMLGDPS